MTKQILNSTANFMIDVFRIISFEYGYRFKMHSHKRIELNYVLKGKCLMMLENELVTLLENNCILILPDSKHDFYVNSKSGVKIAQLEFRLDDPFLFSVNEELGNTLSFLSKQEGTERGFLKIPHTPEICSCMERIIMENKLKRKGHVFLTRLYFNELWVILSRQIDKLSIKEEQPKNQTLAQAVETLQTNFISDITINKLASDCSVSNRYLRQLFKTHLQTRPIDYLNDLRIAKSKELLLNQQYAIKDIAYTVGYSSPQYFCRIFKLRNGITPQKYRQFLLES